MRAGIYTRVSSKRQAQDHTIDQQLASSRSYAQEQGWQLNEEHIYRDDGYSGANLSRPGLDRLRDAAALAEVDVVVITAPDRLARKYLHQVLLIEELESHGVQVAFVERPMSEDPNDQLLLQIRGAVAEYERTLITERMRRGKLAKCGQACCCPGPVDTTATESTRTPARSGQRPRRCRRGRSGPAGVRLVSGGGSGAVYCWQTVGAGRGPDSPWLLLLDGLYGAGDPA